MSNSLRPHVAHQAFLSMGFPRQEYWSGLPFPPPGNLPNPGVEPKSPALAGRFFTTEPPGKTLVEWSLVMLSPAPGHNFTGPEDRMEGR